MGIEFALGFVLGAATTSTACYAWFFVFYILKGKGNGKNQSEN